MHGEMKATKAGGTFAEMRAKARAGKLRGKVHASDRREKAPTAAQSLQAKNVDLQRGISSSGTPIREKH